MATFQPCISQLPQASGHLRPFDVRRDLGGVADLVELCFAETLDADGQSFIQRMRNAAQQPAWLNWAALTAEWASGPFSGYVWEDKGRLVGNVSLIPYFRAGRRFFLIANVAVHPDYRRRGIARCLTEQAIEHVRERRAPCVWLQVREDNPAAVQLYRSLNFEEVARRTTWLSSSLLPEEQLQPGWRFRRPRPAHWPQLRQWLASAYPLELTWHLSFNRNLMRPGLWGDFLRLLADAYIRAWGIEAQGQLKAAAYWQLMAGHANALWLAVDPQTADEELTALLVHLRRRLNSTRALFIEFPARQFNDAIRRAGFYAQQTLIWMRLAL